ncbi:glycosyltransferase [Photobacterium damselae subsp. piscicida]|uniref:glycosyltransferase family 2 protein n=1 Tax=Photobacterium damselae TaxID=38293 RepID=UPI00083EDBFB|nr:glycosyltransferase family 2 protein [Photobacterium damselae]OLQ83189.1 bactoprenol glucosyl transferase [Photobacterium damselae subsp. piscicida]TFZ60947.1 glycosyltransferase [Photobacterium damselae subsp. piscicida]TKA02154.1 glycosyltransferase [Photobacterium damselae subsp. piscicida]BBC41706.1 putative glycosyltransferase [Photobacterium damselae subsp. piscicida]
MNKPMIKEDYRLSLIVPVYNEEESIETFIGAINTRLASIRSHIDIVFINDGSSDNTRTVIENQIRQDDSITLVNLAKNFGKEAAMTAGLNYVEGDAAVILDVDLQDPPELILEFVRLWQTGEYDTVYGVRVDRSHDTFMKRFTAGGFYRFFNLLSSGTRLPENVGDFRLIDRSVIEAIKQLPERNRFMKGLLAWSSFRSIGVDFQRPERCAGDTKFNYWKLWNFAVDGIFSFTAWPLRVWGFIGLGISFLSFIFLIYVLISALFFGIHTPGYASTISVVLFLGGIQLISLGVIGGYISRIYVEVKQRPIYLIEGVYGKYKEQKPNE